MDVRAALRRALDARRDIARGSSAYRLVGGAADGFPGIVVDAYDEWRVLQPYDAKAWAAAPEIARALVDLGARGVYLKVRSKADLRRAAQRDLAPADPIAGSAAPKVFDVHEGPLRLAVRMAEGLQTGLFVDQREGRALVRQLARGRAVLNLFSYTGSFTAAAAVGGATETLSVDLSQRALDGVRENLARNDAGTGRHRMLREDVLRWLPRARRRGDRFGVVVLDPPSFGTREKGTLKVERDYPLLAEGALALLSPGGALLAATNHRGTSRRALAGLVRDAGRRAGRRIERLEELDPPPDCRGARGDAEPSKSVLVRVT